jgi:hypothetical protein
MAFQINAPGTFQKYHRYFWHIYLFTAFGSIKTQRLVWKQRWSYQHKIRTLNSIKIYLPLASCLFPYISQQGPAMYVSWYETYGPRNISFQKQYV